MRIVLQRVDQAEVVVDGAVAGAIGPGLVALVGVAAGDDAATAQALAAKTCELRVFAEGERPFHRSLQDVGGGLLVVSQFTLLGDTRRGRRPSWAQAARPEDAAPLVQAYADAAQACGVEVARGVFGAHMRVSLVNDGPVTLVLDAAPPTASPA